MENLTLSIQPRSDINLHLEKGAIITPATDDKLGGIKTDSANGIYLDEENHLVVDRTDTEARQAAAAAQETADDALTAAQGAQTSADNAQTAADTAQAKAEAADDKATQAQAEAESAQATANQAKANAQQAMTDADDAKGAATSAQAVAGEARDTAGQALTTAQTADGKADSALSQATTATQTADEAKTLATTAQSTAEGAQGAAAAAATAAAAAQATADSKQDALVSGENIKTINDESILGAGNLEILTEIPAATDTELGGIKTNPDSGITLNDDDQLEVDGRLGQFPSTTGIYASSDRDPREVGNYSLLITDALGMNMMSNRALAVVSGLGVACISAPPGTTEYHIPNTYANRIACMCAIGGFASKDEATSKVARIVPVVSVTLNGATLAPTSTDTDGDIIITTEETLNPDSAITNIRLFGSMGSYSTVHAGNGVSSETGGYHVLVGGGITKATNSNGNILVGLNLYSSGNGNAMFGRYHIATKNRSLLAGTGHDTTNARSESASAVGEYSDIKPDTLFAVGNGTSNTDRSNAFEVAEGGVSLPQANYIEIVDKNIAGALTTTNYSKSGAVTFNGTTATFPDSTTQLNVTKKSPAIPVTAGETIMWSYEVRKTDDSVACSFGLNLRKTDATGGSASSNWVNNDASSTYSTEWETRSGTFTVPAGMTYMTPSLAKTMPSGGTATSGAYEVRNLRIYRPDGALVLSSPNGTRYQLTVDDSGNLTTTAM